MNRMTSQDPGSKILEDSLTLHPEICPLNVTGITVPSREGG